jgi:hypothetical protein
MNPLSLLLIAALAGAVVVPAKKPAASPAKERIKSIAEALHKGGRKAKKSPFPGRTERFTEEELNTFIAEEVKKSDEIESVKVKLLDRTLDIEGRARIEWKEVLKGDADSMVGKLLAKAGGLSSTLRIKAQSGAAKGKAYVKVQSVEVNGLTLPQSMVEKLLDSVGKKQRPPLDFNNLIPLPYGVQSFKIEQGALQIGF